MLDFIFDWFGDYCNYFHLEHFQNILYTNKIGILEQSANTSYHRESRTNAMNKHIDTCHNRIIANFTLHHSWAVRTIVQIPICLLSQFAKHRIIKLRQIIGKHEGHTLNGLITWYFIQKKHIHVSPLLECVFFNVQTVFFFFGFVLFFFELITSFCHCHQHKQQQRLCFLCPQHIEHCFAFYSTTLMNNFFEHTHLNTVRSFEYSIFLQFQIIMKLLLDFFSRSQIKIQSDGEYET